MSESRIEVYKINCGRKTFAEIAIEKKELAEDADDNNVFNALFSLFLERLTADEIYKADNTKLGLTFFHSQDEEPNTILSAHSDGMVIEGYVDGGPYDRLRRKASTTNTREFTSIRPDEVVTDRFYIYMYMPLNSTFGILFIERKKGQDIHKPVTELLKEVLKTRHIIRVDKYTPKELIDEYKQRGLVDSFTFTDVMTSSIPDESPIDEAESKYNVLIQIQTQEGSHFDGVADVLENIGNFAFKIGDRIMHLSDFAKKKAKISKDGKGFVFTIGDDLNIRPSVEVPDEYYNDDNDTLNRDRIKDFCDQLCEQIKPDVYPV